jgi:hypothetical protein
MQFTVGVVRPLIWYLRFWWLGGNRMPRLATLQNFSYVLSVA